MTRFTLQNIFRIAIVVLLSQTIYAYKYLAVLHTSARSHHIVGSALMKGLASKGHDVYVISPFPLKKPMEHYHDLFTPNMIKAMEADKSNILEMTEMGFLQIIDKIYGMGLRLTQAVMEEDVVQDLLRSNQTFDAIICEVFLSEAVYGLSEHFNAPLIGLGTFGAHLWNTDMIGSPSPPSYVPNALLPLTDHMTLLQRLGNMAFNIFERAYVDFNYMPKQEALYKKFFPNNKRSLADLQRNTALVLLNQHVSLSFPRPYVPNQIEVGGMHINRKRTPLPADIQKFIDESKHGVIYFSMGSNLRSKDLPLSKREEILNTFRGLKQRVLWKFEEPTLPGKPNNVFISDWFPQDDILAHPNVRMFITHGGLLSSTESIYHGKPIVGIPMFGDQFLNMARASANGYGILVDYKKLSTATFKEAIEKVLNDPTYTQQVQKMSQRYKDQPMKPLDLAVYWAEHIVRHNGAKYLHCAGQDLRFWQYHSIDVLAILIGGISLILFLVVAIIRLLWGCLQNVMAKKTHKVKRS